MPDWATWCWRARTGARMTQAEAARACGVSVRTWSRWENYQSDPPAWMKDRARDAMTMELVSAIPAPTSSPAPAEAD